MTAPVYQWQPTTAQIAGRAGIAPEQVIRFDHNTSPTRPEWVAEIAAPLASTLNEYPGADYRPLREAIAGYAGVDPDRVVAGAGADELIGLSAQAFLPPGGVAVSASPTYALYAVATVQRDAKLVEVSRPAPDFRLPLPELLDAAQGADLIWLCVPNNPTGNRDRDEELEALLAVAGGVVVLDAAYAEFAGDRWAPWVDRHPNLVVLGTLSKAFSLAGIRVGYSLSTPELAAALDRRRPPGSISTLSAAIAEEALRHPERARATVAALHAERDRLAAALSSLGWTVAPSVANFLLAEVGPSARTLAEGLMWEEGMVARSYAEGSPLHHFLRFTVRSPEEDDRLVSTLRRRL